MNMWPGLCVIIKGGAAFIATACGVTPQAQKTVGLVERPHKIESDRSSLHDGCTNDSHYYLPTITTGRFGLVTILIACRRSCRQRTRPFTPRSKSSLRPTALAGTS